MDLMTEQRLARRAAILDAARQMIAERGYAAVTVRDLADVCRVSVPTLYNQFGGKDRLLAAAIEEHFQLARNAQAYRDSPAGFERVLVVIDQCGEQLLNAADYHQRLLEAFSSLAATHEVQERIARALARVLASELEHMQRSGDLVEWASATYVAGQMTTACIGTTVQWGTGVIDDALLNDYLRFGMGLVLLGTLCGPSRAKLETLIESSQRRIEAAATHAMRQSGREQG